VVHVRHVVSALQPRAQEKEEAGGVLAVIRLERRGTP
jgi:hypothetical protein